jgi:hypothetical protein
VDRSGARSKPLGNELERVYVAAAVVQGTAKVMVKGVDVAVAEATGISDLVSEMDGHLVHESEDAAACRLRETNGVRVELAERVGRQATSRRSVRQATPVTPSFRRERSNPTSS